MKTFFATAAALLATASLSLAAKAEWMTDFAAAQAKAKAERKVVLIDFTGSDWCPWCVRMEREIFSKKQFIEFAEKNLVLVKADFPEDKPQSAALQRQNLALKKKYRVEEFPTIMLIGSNGKEIGNTRYEEGGLENYLNILGGIVKRN